jgi:hypothetical protein
VKALVFFLLLVVTPGLAAQEAPRKKKPEAKKHQVAHKKPTPEQIRKFKDLEKKQKKG